MGLFGDIFGEVARQRTEQIEAEGRITDNVHLKITFSEFLLFTCEGAITSAVIHPKTPLGVYAPPEPPERTEKARLFAKGILDAFGDKD